MCPEGTVQQETFKPSHPTVLSSGPPTRHVRTNAPAPRKERGQNGGLSFCQKVQARAKSERSEPGPGTDFSDLVAPAAMKACIPAELRQVRKVWTLIVSGLFGLDVTGLLLIHSSCALSKTGELSPPSPCTLPQTSLLSLRRSSPAEAFPPFFSVGRWGPIERTRKRNRSSKLRILPTAMTPDCR